MPIVTGARDDWLAISAAGLVVGSMALLSAIAVSAGVDSTAEALMAVRDEGGRWLSSALGYFVAAAGLALGVPALLAAVPGRGRGLAQAGVALLCVGFTGLAGFAFMLILVRSLVVTEVIDAPGLSEMAHESGLTAFLYTWLAAFYLGELLFALGLLRAGATVVPRWIPVLMLLHVAGVGLAGGPAWVAPVVTALLAMAFCGLGIRVAQAPRGA